MDMINYESMNKAGVLSIVRINGNIEHFFHRFDDEHQG